MRRLLPPSLLLALAAALVPAPGARSEEAPEKAYAACMDLARASPRKARVRAEAWLAKGGGLSASHCRAVALLGLGLYVDAAEALQRLGEESTSLAAALRSGLLHQAGNAWMIAGRPERALDVLTGALAIAPARAELLIDRSIALAGMARDWEAVDDLNEAIEAAPASVDALLFRATAYRRLGVLELAAEDISRALALAPKNGAVLLEHGNIMRLAGDAVAARASWRRVVEFAPDSPEAVSASANLRRLDGPAARRGGPAPR